MVCGCSALCGRIRYMCYVYRWKRNDSGAVLVKEGKPILEFVAIRRKDNNCWAIPGVSSVVTCQITSKNSLCILWATSGDVRSAFVRLEWDATLVCCV